MDNGLLIVVSGPSGAGKGTIYHSVIERLPAIKKSVSVTTRAPRAGEIEGVHYFFRTEAQFAAMQKKDGFLETAAVYGHFYGTPKARMLEILARGEDAMLEIDICGAMQIKRHYPDSVLIFIMPPSLALLEERLRGRRTDSEESIALRLKEARRELKEYERFDYVVVNDVLEKAINEVTAVITAERCRSARCRSAAQKIIN